MNKYQKYWNTEIEKLLKELGANKNLHNAIAFVLSNSQLTQVFPNQIINALKTAIEIKKGEKNIALVAPMQSGKSGTVFALCNYVLPALRFIKNRESIVFVTSMTDTDLYDQNKKNLEKDFYCPIEKTYKPSFIHVIKMSGFFKHPNPHKIVRDLNVKLIVRDEDQYGCGQESSFDTAFFSSLRSKMPDIKLLSVSATPYDILDAKLRGAPVEVVEGERPISYFGISEMLKLGLVEDYPSDFKPVIVNPDNESETFLHYKLNEYIKHLLKFEDGLGIIRVSNTISGVETRSAIKNIFGSKLECLIIGSNKECDYKIKDGLSEVKKRVLLQKKKIVLIVVHALSAGKDLQLLKPKVRFGIESRNKQLANGSQGIAGRLCGYHNNRDFKILASNSLLKHYSEFEQDWEVFANDVWRNELYNMNVRGLTTQTKFQLNQREGMFTPVTEMSFYSKEDLEKNSVREELSFIDNNTFSKLKKCFSPGFYNRITKGYRLNQEGVTVRIASSYNPESNRVYKNWSADFNSDFGSVSFKKSSYEYGFLISNFPLEDNRNKIGVCGIKIFKSGTPHLVSQETEITNYSMYGERENVDELMDSFVGFVGTNENKIEKV